MKMKIQASGSFSELFESVLSSMREWVRGGGVNRADLRGVVVPSRTFGDELQKGFAQRFGVCMGWRFLIPKQFVHLVMGEGEEGPWG
ncbi:MAG: hypothetical protein N2035_07140, partial [Chthoniobacterales bacterium]|nr:hypothetical protein [Chthoniobacterales bacterium]